MTYEKLDRWAEMLLDTGKRNNLINFHGSKASSVQIAAPQTSDIFDRLDTLTSFEIFDPIVYERCSGKTSASTVAEETDETAIDALPLTEEIMPASSAVNTEVNIEASERTTVEADERRKSVLSYAGKLKRSQLLLYSDGTDIAAALKKIDKKARSYVEETGVNVAYMAFGFIKWCESDNSQLFYRAPLLLVPVSFYRESSLDPWMVRVSGDEILVNPTFSFKLDHDYGIKLEEYTDGGYTAYADSVAELLAPLGWTVSHECNIGIFSFLKINMYRDIIDHRDRILANNNIRLLMGEPDAAAQSSEFSRVKDPLERLHNVVDADSSQIEAIQLAKSGTSFVLQGPPGAGKSQTITNIIAESIYDGKRVLFVSEKQAALNVVYDKLRRAGLGEFCLELHSHKANKKAVVDELCSTLRSAKSSVSPRAEQVILSKQKSREKLDTYADELHRVRSRYGCSLYQLLADHSSCRTAPAVKYIVSDIYRKDERYLERAVELLTQYVGFLPVIGANYRDNAWYGCICTDTSFERRESLYDDLRTMSGLLHELSTLNELTSADFGLGLHDLRQVEVCGHLFALLAESDFLTPSFLDPERFVLLSERLNELESLSEEILALRDLLDSQYEREIYELDASDLLRRLMHDYNGSLGRVFSSDYHHIINEIKLCRRDGHKLSYDSALSLLRTLIAYNEKCAAFAALEAQLRDSLGSAWRGVDSDWSLIDSDLSRLSAVYASGLSTAGLADRTLFEHRLDRPLFAEAAAETDRLLSNCAAPVMRLAECFDSRIFDLYGCDLAAAQGKLDACLTQMNGLENWCAFRTVLIRADELQLRSFIDLTIAESIAPEQVVDCFRRCIYSQWIDSILHSEEIFRAFHRIEHDQQVSNFIKQDILQFAVNTARIRSELSARRPSAELITTGSAVSLLLREGEKKRSRKSIRTLLSETGSLVQQIKPCFLMSPLSISTFLSADDIDFDLVIFDEASQIFPQDAIGAIYRCRQMIIVGDSRQMPPSNFFSAPVEPDEYNEADDAADFESILDLGSVILPQLRLKWHYRSRYEQLIAFSNRNFYDNELVTFPSPAGDARWTGVDYYHVDGLFDHRSRTNRREAEFIVDQIYENIRLFPQRSLGVVAFSISQQELIDLLLQRRRQEDPSAEDFFRRDTEEPFFIKNLETVQGDERDTVIFSVAYGSDESGRLLHNFGPLNKVGGERRLNVAVTRARMNVQLVSSMHYTDIDLKRTSAEGARLLRDYLDYAENGTAALERSISVSENDCFDSEFEREVHDFLCEHSFAVDTQIGCSNFRIDLGLRRPDSSDYVLAIECDGAAYHSSANARDRDRLRQQILERMGWKFYRIWSTDWFRNTAAEQQRLLAAARAALGLEDETDEQSVDAEVIPADTDGETTDGFEHDITPQPCEFSFYRELSIGELTALRREQKGFIPFVRRVLEVEAPLSEEWLMRRIMHDFNRERISETVLQEFDAGMKGCEKYGITRRCGFLYLLGNEKLTLRVPNGESGKRELKYISTEELAAGMLTAISRYSTVEKSGLYRFIADKLGIVRLTESVTARFDQSLTLLNGFIDCSDGMLSLKKIEADRQE